jgi:hypothetical protein
MNTLDIRWCPLGDTTLLSQAAWLILQSTFFHQVKKNNNLGLHQSKEAGKTSMGDYGS